MTTRFADHLLDGDHASRPAATTVPAGTLYSCTTHDLVYQSDGSAWSTWATLGGGGGSGGAVTLLDESILASDTTTVEFSSISQDHDELIIEIVGRSTRVETQDAPRIRFGNSTIDSGSNYDSLGWDTSTNTSENGQTSGQVTRFGLPAASSSANRFCAITIVIPQYTNTSFHKSYQAWGGFSDGANGRLGQSAGTWESTSAIDIINLICANGDWASGSVFRLYGRG